MKQTRPFSTFCVLSTQFLPLSCHFAAFTFPDAFVNLFSSTLKMGTRFLSSADFSPAHRILTCEVCRCKPSSICRDDKFPHIANLICGNNACLNPNWWLCTICHTSAITDRKLLHRHNSSKAHKKPSSVWKHHHHQLEITTIFLSANLISQLKLLVPIRI